MSSSAPFSPALLSASRQSTTAAANASVIRGSLASTAAVAVFRFSFDASSTKPHVTTSSSSSSSGWPIFEVSFFCSLLVLNFVLPVNLMSVSWKPVITTCRRDSVAMMFFSI